MAEAFRTDLRDRLPLPLARLYRRAHNAKSWLERHGNALYLLEAAVKLAATAQISVYLASDARLDDVDRRLRHLALPSLGHWVEIFREVSAATARLDDHPFPDLASASSLLKARRDDLPALALALAAMGEKVEGVPPFSKDKVRFLDLVDRLPAYRNQVVGHGALRDDRFYAEMADLLLAAAVEWFQKMPLFGGAVLVQVEEVRESARNEIHAEVWDLTGPEALRATAAGGEPLPPGADLRPGRLYFRKGDAFLDLHPLVVCAPAPPDAGVLFLNRSQVDRRVEYLDYVTGETSNAPHLLDDHRAILGRLLGRELSPSGMQELQQRSLSDDGAGAAKEEVAEATTQRFGDFDLLAKLGAGGMGTVYLARQLSLGRLVALKVLPPALSTDEVAAARFRREVHACARADHPNVVRVLQSGRTEGTYWFAMEYVEGGDLSRVSHSLGRGRSRGGLSDDDLMRAVDTVSELDRERVREAMSMHADTRALVEHTAQPVLGEGRTFYRRIAEVFRDAAQGLQHLHDGGVLHRDVKPANLMLTRNEGRAVVMDLGLARLPGEAGLTKPDAVLGTIQYTAPEQLQQGLLTVDARADVYGLGATLYELATGRPPYEADSTEALVAKVLATQAPPPRRVEPDVPPDLDAIVQKAMEREPDRRYQSMAALADDLDHFARGEPVAAHPPGLARLLRLWVRKHAVLAATIATALLVIVVGTLLFLRSLGTQRDRAEQARERAEHLQGAAERERDRARSAEERARDLLGGNYLLRAKEAASSAGAFLYAAQATDVADRPDTRAALIEAAARTHAPLWISPGGVPGVFDAAWRPGSKQVATAGNVIRLWDAATGDLEAIYPGPDGDPDVLALAFDPTGARIAGGDRHGRILVWQTDVPSVETVHPGRHEEGTAVLAVAWSRSGRWIASSGTDGTVRIWDTEILKDVVVLRGHQAKVGAVAIASDGSWVVSGSADRTVCVWDVEKRRVLHRLEGHEDGITTVSVDPEEVRIVSTDAGGGIVVWDRGSGERLAAIQVPGGAIHGAARGADGTRLLTAHADGAVRLVDLSTDRILTFRGEPHPGAGTAVAWSPDGGLALSGSVDGFDLRLWNVTERRAIATRDGHGGAAYDIAVVEDGKRVASCSNDGTIRLLDAATGEAVASWKTDESVLTIDTDPSGEHLVAGLGDGSVLLFQAATLELDTRLGRHTSPVSRVTFSPEGTLVASSDGSGHVHLWDTTAKTRRWTTQAAVRGNLAGLAFRPDGQVVASAGTDPVIRLWEADGGTEVGRLEGHSAEVSSLVFHPDGSRLFSASADGTIRVWDLDTGTELVVLEGHVDPIDEIALSEDGHALASAGFDGSVRVWETATYREVGRLEGHLGRVWSVAFAPGRDRLFSGGGDRSVRAWALDRALPDRLFAEPGRMRCAQFSPDGRRLAAGGTGGGIEDPQSVLRVWDTQTGVLLNEVPAHLVSVKGLTWNRGGDRVATVGGDWAVRVWDTDSWEKVAEMRWHERDVPSDIALAPDDRRIAVACETGVRMWDLPSGAELAHLRNPDVDSAEAAAEKLTDTAAVAFDADSRHLLSATWGGMLEFWDVVEKRRVRVIRADPKYLLDVAVSPDGTLVATTGSTGAVRIWRNGTYDEVVALTGHQGPVLSVCWSPDGRRVYSASSDQTLVIWDIATARAIARFTLPTEQPQAIALNPNESRLAAAGARGTVFLWSLAPLAWPAGTCLERAETETGYRLEPPADVVPPVPTRFTFLDGR